MAGDGGVCLVGFGRVGRATAHHLARMGYPPLVVDGNGRRVDEARREGFDAYLGDAGSPSMATRLAEGCSVVATALPSDVAVTVVGRLIRAGARKIVDVSYVRDPLVFDVAAREAGARVFVDAGLAPGLTNMIVAYTAERLGGLSEALIHVGGLAAHDADPVGLVASWNMMDLVEEYTRPARARVKGRLVTLNPIDDAVRVEVPGVGVFDALPTDGLRTLLQSLRTVDTLVEYTLRYPGHVELLRGRKRLGLLDDKSYVVGGCSITPRRLLARLLEERLPSSGDRVVLYVKASGRGPGSVASEEYVVDSTQEDIGASMPLLSYLTGLVHAWATVQALRGAGQVGVNPPELLAPRLPELFEELRSVGVPVARRSCVSSVG